MIDPSLLDPSAVGHSLRSLAQRVDKGGDADSAQRLRLLGDIVVKKGSSSISWATVDINKMVDPDSIVEYYRQRHATLPGCMLELIEAARNILIFAPIIVTWLGISQATASYNDYIAAALVRHDTTQLSQPFLYLWEQGFGGRLAGWLTLSSIAGVDVFILATIIILTLLAHMLSSANRLREENNARKLHADLVHAVARVTLCLHDGQQQLQMVGGSSSKQMDQVAVAIRAMAGDIMNTFKTLENDLAQKFMQIANDLGNQVQQGGKYLGTLGSTATSLKQLAQTISTTAQDLTSASQSMTKSLNDLLTPAQTLAQQQSLLVQSVDKSVNLLQVNASALKDITKQQTTLGNDLALSLGAMGTAAQKMDDLVLRIGTFVKKQEDLLQEMGKEHTAQAQVADDMKKAMVSAQEAQKALSKLTIDFRQIAVDTNEVLRLYAGLPKLLGPDMTAAMQLLHKSGGDLSSAAMSIFSASQFFEKVVADQEQLVSQLVASGKI